MKTKLVIFGITGDLSGRYLLPALSRIIATGDFNELSIIGVSRRHVEQYEVLGEKHEDLSGTTSMFTMDLENPDDYTKLRDRIDLKDDEQAIFYLSVPPTSSGQIVELLGKSGLNTPNIKILLEKPFGTDLASAREMITHVGQYYDEAQVYRIDHYLAKEMAQNILIFRASNAIFNHIWDNRFIEKIEIIASESINIEGRAHFYEQTGALRDFVQGHLMQLLSLTIMDVPENVDQDDIPARRLAAIQQVQPADPAKTIRGQYQGYRDQVDNPQSTVETFVSLELSSDNEKWRNVPMFLTTGKALNEKQTEIRIYFRRQHEGQANCLKLCIQPNEGVELNLYARKPGYDNAYEERKLRFDYTYGTELHDAYEQVMVDAIRSRKSLFATGDEVLRSWEILKPLQDAWAANDAELKMYSPGSTVDEVTGRSTYS